ncbi:uv-damaged DNA-binding protein [Niveomyces insectorum RCEF 264]|uniref:DNA damage-binding protein 1 n=1 Tax=Niveomyces insectorum RCEF 264 TaxID=1081102 RepID=A0A167YVR3_9HYPO|nr:uv-damaged DNA-binding protein [Niveomyces insectorum RCEF 264]
MAYIAPIHRPSSVRHALRIKLLSPDEESIVLSKANRLEIWRFTEENELALFQSRLVFGSVTMLEVLRPKEDSETELLFVGTDRFDYFTLAWDPKKQSLDTVDNFHDIGEKHLRDSQSQDRCVVDPSGRYMALLLWEGVLSVLRMQSRRDKARNLDLMDQVRLSELFIKACTFLHSETGHPRIAFLYQTQADTPESKLSSYRLTSDDRNTVAARFDPARDRELNLDIADPGAAMLIPVERVELNKRHFVRNNPHNAATAKAHLGGLLVVGETRLLYIDDTTNHTVEAPLRAATIFVAWARYDATHYFLGDNYGSLHLLTILAEGTAVTGLNVSQIGKTSRAAALVYVEARRMLFVGSHSGDSQLFKVDLTSSTDNFCALVQVMRNIGPILDFTVMDMGNREVDKQLANEYASGQARIVTGSGVHKDGSLRSVRSGVGLEDVGVLDETGHVRALFSLRTQNRSQSVSPPPPPPPKVDTLVVSGLTETRAFVFDSEGGIEEVDSLPGITLTIETLWAANLPDSGGNRVLQITPHVVTVAELDSGVTVASWSPPNGKTITSASANGRWALLSVEGTLLVSLDLARDLAVAAQKDFGTDQIACIHASPQLLDTGVVGMWTAGSVTLVDLGTLQPTQSSETVRHKEDNASVARSLALVQVLPPQVAGPTLFVAMDDGSVVTFAVSPHTGTLSSRKSVILGTRHASLHLLPQAGGVYNVFATTEHPSLIYGSENRTVYAAVTAEDASVVCAFDAEAFPNAVVVATATQIKLSRIDAQRQTHVQTVEMGETVRRIAYSPAEKVFALGCVAQELTHGREVVTSSVKLVDEVLFRPLGKPLALDAERAELVECVIRAELRDAHGDPVERFVVGTSYLTGDGDEGHGEDPTLGRLLVLGVDADRSLYQVSAHRLRGPCRCLGVLQDGLIVAGLSRTVVLFRHVETTSLSATLRKVAAARTATYVIDLAVHGNMIAVGDMMKSTSLLRYVPAVGRRHGDDDGSDNDDNNDHDEDGKKPLKEPAKLVTLARNYQASWATAVCYVEGEAWLEADGFGNLSVLERNVDGVTEEDRRRLRATSEMNLGESVNRIRPIAVESSANAMVHPKAFLATVEGSIYLFGTVAASAQDLLMNLQAKLETVVRGLGNTTFSAYRGFYNAEREAGEPNRFLDGEMLERFLDLDDELQKEVAQGLGPSVEDLRNSIEELKRMH